MCWKHSWKRFCEGLFSSSVAFLMSVSSHENHLFNSDFSGENRSKVATARSREYGWFSSVVTLFFAKKPLNKPDRCAGALSWIRKRLLCSPFFGAFPSDHISTATKDVNEHFFIYISKCCKLYQRIPGSFCRY